MFSSPNSQCFHVAISWMEKFVGSGFPDPDEDIGLIPMIDWSPFGLDGWLVGLRQFVFLSTHIVSDLLRVVNP